jgi:NAD(P)-dependent dehydrogenase (short-subunit alcohol dehydrogenase family)
MAGRLKGKVALVTGAGSSGPGWGNGKATAVLFAREGAKVFAVDLNLAAAEETVGLIADEGGRAVAHQADVTDGDGVKAMVAACLARFGPIDVLHNNVGILQPGGVVEASEASWDRVMEVNLKSMFLTCKAVVPIMEAQGAGAIARWPSSTPARGSAPIRSCRAS